TLHGTDITLVGSHPFYKSAVTFSINKSDAVTSVSQNLKDDTMRLFNIKRDIDVVPNFIDLEKHDLHFTDCQRDLMAEPHERIITHISNFRPVKRIRDIIQVFYKIQKEMPAKLMMVGEGPEKEPAEMLCEKMGIADKVIFFGNSSEIDKILCFSDLFLLPSETESFGLAALEAMASGVPVISSNTGGIPEVNKHGVSGFLSEVGDIDDMTSNALYILKDEKRLAEFKKNAIEESKRFNIHEIVPMYEAIYERALANCISI
ncbi:MAG: N-acetyl-alpha-D-glucosaminyl L-malate synthase BshA, partial [Flavobacteriaceae bacterium]|nr:N-acetyl-alpha-D-glucosaminyl L-malate synthase BshA [Flavobacteriaceae bacterium]